MYPFVHLGGEEHYKSTVSCPRTQHNVPGQGSKTASQSGVEHTSNHDGDDEDNVG